MKKYLLKLDKHIVVIQDILDGKFKLVDVDGNEIEIDEVPDYILEIESETELVGKNHYVKSFFYPKDFELFKTDFFVWYHKSNADLQEFLRDIKSSEKVDILKVDEI